VKKTIAELERKPCSFSPLTRRKGRTPRGTRAVT